MILYKIICAISNTTKCKKVPFESRLCLRVKAMLRWYPTFPIFCANERLFFSRATTLHFITSTETQSDEATQPTPLMTLQDCVAISSLSPLVSERVKNSSAYSSLKRLRHLGSFSSLACRFLSPASLAVAAVWHWETSSQYGTAEFGRRGSSVPSPFHLLFFFQIPLWYLLSVR